MAKLDQTRLSRVYFLFLSDIYRGGGDNILGFLKLLARRLTVLVPSKLCLLPNRLERQALPSFAFCAKVTILNPDG